MIKVLIADDVEENRFVLRVFFNLFGKDAHIEIREAKSGLEVIQSYPHWSPDLLLIDIKMESENAGLDACKAIRSNDWQQGQIWAVTAQAMVASEEEQSIKNRCFEAGCERYFTKPFDQVELLTAISKTFKLPIPAATKERMKIS